MARPIANAANVKARTRRRQGPPTLLRSALVIALVVVCLFSAPVVLAALRPSLASSLGPAVGDNGPSRLGWGGKRSYRVNNHGLLGDSSGGMNANDQLANDAFGAQGRATGGRTARPPSPREEP